ncbi:MAG: hypothetical protein WBY94_22005 [Polyangiaceae bacterium]
MHSLVGIGAAFLTVCTAIACGTSEPGPIESVDASPGDGSAADHGAEGAPSGEGDGGYGDVLLRDSPDNATATEDGASDPAQNGDGGQGPVDSGPDTSQANDGQSAVDGGSDVMHTVEASSSIDSGQDSAKANDASQNAIDGGVCGALAAGPLPDGGDATYSWASSPKAGCLSAPFCQVACDANLLAGLLSCDAVQGGYYWAQGSVYMRVAGRQSGECVYEIGVETEGSVSYSRCTTPLPAKPWHGLFYLNTPSSSAAPDVLNGLDNCQVVSTCNLMSGAPNPCDPSAAGPPMCPANNVYGPC